MWIGAQSAWFRNTFSDQGTEGTPGARLGTLVPICDTRGPQVPRIMLQSSEPRLLLAILCKSRSCDVWLLPDDEAVAAGGVRISRLLTVAVCRGLFADRSQA